MASSKRPSEKGNVTDIAAAREQRVSPEKSVEPKAKKATKAKKVSNRKFDHEKVASIKAAIANGTYQINAQRIADKFIEQESP